MKIYLSPQVNEEIITYEFDGDIIRAEIGSGKDTFDFSGVPDGALNLINQETGEDLIETSLPVNPILSAEKRDGILYVRLLNWIPADASESERFPDWIDAKDYEPPEKPEPSPEPGEESESEENPLENWGEF